MREMSSQSINMNRRRSQFRGGETRIMKRALSSLLVFALVLTLLVPAFAFAADKTTEEKFNELKEKGLLKGVEDGSAALDKELTRAELAAILVRLFKLEPITGQSTFIDVPATHWAQKEGVIEAVAKAGLMGSTTTYSKTFSPDAKLTIAEVATVAVRALKLTVDENAKIDGVQPWAAPYVDAALKAQVIKEAKDYHATANRGILVEAAYVIYNTILVPPVTDATKVESVSATNLKEVVVKFDGTVDADSAENVENYSLSLGGGIKSATLSEDGTEVTLTVVTKLTNQAATKLSVKGVKAGNNTVSVKDYVFTPVDNQLPQVVNVSSLGTKAIKVEFSEPIEQGNLYSYYKLDGKTFYGTANGEGTRTIILKPYNANALTIGEHTLEIDGVTDFHVFKVLKSEHKFTVVEDKEAPTIKDVKATLEYVKVTFSKPVDPDTVKASNVYWDTKSNTANSVDQLSADTFGFTFRVNPLPYFETTLNLEGVKDYSDNALNPSSVKVKAEIDNTRPEVKSVKLDASRTFFTVEFSKAITVPSSTSVGLFKVTNNSNGTVIGLDYIASVPGNEKALRVYFYSPLPAGSYTVEITGVRDATLQQNLMVDYKGSLDSNVPPTVSTNAAVNPVQRIVVITFSQEMDVTTLGEPRNYLMRYDGVWSPLPDNVGFEIVQNAQGIKLYFPERYNSANFNMGLLTSIRLTGLKDTKGNWLIDPITNAYFVDVTVAYSEIEVTEARAINKTTIEVDFDQPIAQAYRSDFNLLNNEGASILSVVADFTNTVTITLDKAIPTDLDNVTLEIVPGNNITSAAHVKYATEDNSPEQLTLVDKIKPELRSVTVPNDFYETTVTIGGVTKTVYGQITLTFSEDLDFASQDYFANDLIVKNESNNKTLTAGINYDYVAVKGENDKTVNIYFLHKNSPISNNVFYYVAVRDGAQYIQDTHGNKAVKSNSIRTAQKVVLQP